MGHFKIYPDKLDLIVYYWHKYNDVHENLSEFRKKHAFPTQQPFSLGYLISFWKDPISDRLANVTEMNVFSLIDIPQKVVNCAKAKIDKKQSHRGLPRIIFQIVPYVLTSFSIDEIHSIRKQLVEHIQVSGPDIVGIVLVIECFEQLNGNTWRWYYPLEIIGRGDSKILNYAGKNYPIGPLEIGGFLTK